MELSKNIRSHIWSLICLHSLIEAGEGNESGADGIRDEMDVTVLFLSSDERDLVEGLSGDLYLLSGEEVIEEDPAAPAYDIQLSEIMELANEKRDWEGVLKRLRTLPIRDGGKLHAELRGKIWLELGHVGVARLFLGHAAVVHLQNAR